VSERVLLARRASGRDHAVVFDGDHLRIEGGFALRRRVPYRAVNGLERVAPWLWLGVGVVPAALGGHDVPPERLDAVERELRARIAALPEGAERIARVDRRRPGARRVPWLSVGGVLVGSLVWLPGAAAPLAVATHLLFCLAFALVVEGWLGRGSVLVGAGAGLLAAHALAAGAAGAAGMTPPALSAAWIGLLGFARTVRAAELPVLTRGAIDTAALVAVGFCALALGSGVSPRLLFTAALGGFASGALTLRRPTPDR
jgi:hypothetical protein